MFFFPCVCVYECTGKSRQYILSFRFKLAFKDGAKKSPQTQKSFKIAFSNIGKVCWIAFLLQNGSY